MRRLAILLLVVSGALTVPASLCTANEVGAAQLPHDTDITLAARKEIVVPPPTEDRVEVPERYRGSHVVHNKEGKEQTVDFTAAYRAGYVVGWRDFLAEFQSGRFDLDEVEGDRLKRFVSAYQSVGGEPLYPGQLAGAAACRDALVALAHDRKLVYLPAKPQWVKRLRVLRACEPELNDAGHPTCIWWNYTTEGQKLSDEDLKIFNDIPLNDLESLGLDHVSVSDAGIAALPPMPKLKTLEISSKRLTGVCLHTLRHFPQLSYLAIPGLDSVKTEDVTVLGHLKKLEFLNLQGAELEDDAVPIFLSLPRLSRLILEWSDDGSRGPHFSPEGISRFRACRSLRLLRLTGCAVDDSALEALASSLSELDDLFVNRTQITDASLSAIHKLRHLTWFSCGETKVTDAGILALGPHPSIETICLEGTRVGDASLVALATMPRLKTIWASPGQFSAAAISEFEKRRREVRIAVIKARDGQVPVDSIGP